MNEEMILLGDSGSTHTRWIVLDNRGFVQHDFDTAGFNPYIYNKEELLGLLECELHAWRGCIGAIRFYGAGCTPAKAYVVKESLQEFFRIDNIEVYSDLMAVVHSLGRGVECIAAILGTGSNSCYYDGENIAEQTPALGYILGDEGSGAVLGRKLLGDVLKNQLPREIIGDFYETYHLDQYQIIEKVYKEVAPNRFMAGFAPFIKKHIADASMQGLVERSFSEFVERNLLGYTRIKSLPVHFTGGIATHFKEQLQSVFHRYGLLLGTVSPDPMEGLIAYYRNRNA